MNPTKISTTLLRVSSEKHEKEAKVSAAGQLTKMMKQFIEEVGKEGMEK